MRKLADSPSSSHLTEMENNIVYYSLPCTITCDEFVERTWKLLWFLCHFSVCLVVHMFLQHVFIIVIMETPLPTLCWTFFSFWVDVHVLFVSFSPSSFFINTFYLSAWRAPPLRSERSFTPVKLWKSNREKNFTHILQLCIFHWTSL